jgi:hypothetical protein
MLIKCRVKIVNNRVVCDNEKKLTEKIEHKKDLLNEGYGYIKNKDKLKHLLDIGVDLSQYHPSILRVVCDAGRDSKLNEIIKPQLELIAKESHDKGFVPSTFGYNNKLHKHIKTLSGHVKHKYTKKPKSLKTPLPMPNKTPSKKEVKGGSITEDDIDVDEVLSEIESDIEAGEITDAENKLKTIKNKIPKKVYKKLSSTIRS